MLNVYLVDQVVLPLVEMLANRLLRLIGGPHHVTQRNDDFIWF